MRTPLDLRLLNFFMVGDGVLVVGLEVMAANPARQRKAKVLK
jgi:hypothetical protein